MTPRRVLLITKRREDPFADEAIRFVEQHFAAPLVVRGDRGETLPDVVRDWRGDVLVSYLAPWILPADVLKNAAHAAINFHPGPPEYPGIGCYNFALYDEAPNYGVTCHHMAPAVDSGGIISVRRFGVLASDNVHSLAQRSSAHLLCQFLEIMSGVLRGEPLPTCDEKWQGPPRTRREMLELFRIAPEMPAEEVRRRIRAAEHPDWPGAYVEIHGEKFHHQPTK